MGRRGPAPKSDAMRRLHGTDKYQKGGGVKANSSGNLQPPKCLKLTRQEKVVWREVVPMLEAVPGLLADVDTIALAGLCMAIAEVRDARAEIAEHGPTATSEKGGAYQHPAVGRKNKALEQVRYWAAQFGMTPTARARLEVEEAAAPGNRFEKFINRQMRGDQ